MAIYNYLFEIAREERKKEEEAIKFLQSKGYVISNKKKTYASKKKKHASSKLVHSYKKNKRRVQNKIWTLTI